ncbi:F-box protein [Aspergillus puulaauensis]|uniref:F-box domain-containing protein n=1 Tax=Aspergillus puulaauensis TaxID=1220207 RepID=A0A7R7XV05_9EURO|nr:uncharacterized protein APUU_61309S [Aspergillus puulaauensis]BCS28261.1 hypothetical protein APUU_61309S [Aspergillus puulaauensis]
MLSDLPPELLLLIADHLASYKNTLRLASCCRQLHALLGPRAYTTLTFDNFIVGHLSCLVSTLARSPQYARAVRILQFKGLVRPDPYHKVRYDRDAIQPTVKKAALCQKEFTQWEHDLENGKDSDPWLTALLLLLPNLEQLEMTWEYPVNYMTNIIHRVTQDPHNTTLSRLKEVSFFSGDIGCVLPSYYVRRFLHLPSLRRFTVDQLWDGCSSDRDLDDRDLHNKGPNPGGFSNVTHLHLHRSYSRTGLLALTRAPKRLESFLYDNSAENNSLEPLNSATLYSALRKYRDSLQHITVSADPWTPSSDTGFGGSFIDFTTLKKLRLRALVILDWRGFKGAGARNKLPDVLPASLESLAIDAFHECDCAYLATSLEAFIRDVKSHAPNLATLEIEGQIHEKFWLRNGWRNAQPRPVPRIETKYLEMTRCLAVLCREASIQFRLRDRLAEEIIKRRFGV